MGDQADRINDESLDCMIGADFGEGIKPPKRRKAPGEGKTRKDHDAYDTDPALARACVEWVMRHCCLCAPYILEPTAGTGPYVRAAREVFPDSVILAIDIRPEVKGLGSIAGANYSRTMDALALPPETIRSADLIITNPPFKLADALVRHFWASMKPGATLAFLLSVTFIASADRWEGGEGLFKACPLRFMVPIVPRPQFLNVNAAGEKASSPIEAALFVWTKYAEGQDPYFTQVPFEPLRWSKT